MTVLHYICLCCDNKKGHGTLRRIRPYKIYVCEACVKMYTGLPAIQARLPQLMNEFQERRKKETEPLEKIAASLNTQPSEAI